MSNVITQFLIGIGYQYDDKGERAAKAGMEAIKSSTLAIGSTLAAATVGAGAKVDQLAEKSRKLQDQLYRTSTPVTWAQGYGVALTELGGNADDAVGRITGLEQKLAALKMGDRSFIDSLGQAGFDASDLSQAKNAQDFITRASEQFSKATHTQQVNMANVMGLTDAEFKLWQQGGAYVDDHSKKLAEQIGYTESLNQKQYEYSQSWVQLNLEMDKAGNTISNIMLPGMTELVKKANEYTSALNKFAQENPETTKNIVSGGAAVGLGAAILTGGKILSKVPGLGALGSVAAPAATVVGGGLAANSAWDSIMNFSDTTYGTDTTGGGNFKKNSPLGKLYNFTYDGVSSAPDAGSYLSKPTHGADYMPSSYGSSDYNAAAVGGIAAAAVSALPPIKVDNKLTMTGTVELDGRQMGELIDAKIDQHNQQAIVQYDTQVDR
ncbi:tape measure protein [Phage vB_KsaM-C1]|nr:tape measure protein [Phage vB_KsaM-C1]